MAIFATKFNLLALLIVINLRYYEVDESFIWVARVTAYETFIEVIFESVPQMIIQILNNQETLKQGESWNTIMILSTVFSGLAIVWNIIRCLIQICQVRALSNPHSIKGSYSWSGGLLFYFLVFSSEALRWNPFEQ